MNPDKALNFIGRFAVGVSVIVFIVGCGRPAQDEVQPSVRVSSGWSYYRLGEFSLALKEFQQAIAKTTPGEALHLAALYGEAATWHLRRPDEDLAKAAQLYRRIIELAPTNSLAAWSWLGLARITALPVDGALPDLKPQVEAYQAVMDRFPFHPAGEEAFLLQQVAKLDVLDRDRTREVLEALQGFIETHPDSPWRSSAYGLMIHCGEVLGLPDLRLASALKAWQVSEIDPANPVKGLSWTYWRIATLAEFETGDFEVAREYYRKLIKEYPTDRKVFLAKQELKRMDDLEARLKAEGGAP